jgi:uncharacterized membrane protein
MHFKKSGWIYVPVSILGWLITIIYLSISIYTLVAIDKNYNSFTNSFIRFFPYFVSYSVVFFWIAGNTRSDEPEEKDS